MSGTFQSRFTPQVAPVNTAVTITGTALGFFLCQTAGTITLVKNNIAQTPLLVAFPVAAGTNYSIPIRVGENGAIFTTAGGASGLLGVG